MPDPDSTDAAHQAHSSAKQALADTKRLFIKLIIFGVILGSITAFGVVKFISTLNSNLAPSTQQNR